MMRLVKRTERGFAGHLCVAQDCLFRRNTLLEMGELRIVVSTVGNYHPAPAVKTIMGLAPHEPDTIGLDRMYETMAFMARWEAPYWEADVSQEVSFDSDWAIAGPVTRESDAQADAMHEAVVAELVDAMPTRDF